LRIVLAGLDVARLDLAVNLQGQAQHVHVLIHLEVESVNVVCSRVENDEMIAFLVGVVISSRDYKRFLNFLAAHDCRADFREFRNGIPLVRPRRGPVLPSLTEAGK
jgi:hypothetical protein